MAETLEARRCQWCREPLKECRPHTKYHPRCRSAAYRERKRSSALAAPAPLPAPVDVVLARVQQLRQDTGMAAINADSPLALLYAQREALNEAISRHTGPRQTMRILLRVMPESELAERLDAAPLLDDGVTCIGVAIHPLADGRVVRVIAYGVAAVVMPALPVLPPGQLGLPELAKAE